MPQPKKRSKKSLTNSLDKLCSLIIRSKGRCEFCHNTETLQCAHIYSRSYRNLRWDLNNLLCLCAKCHFEGHKKPIDFTERVKKILGEENYKELILNSQRIMQWKLHEMITLEEKLKKHLDTIAQ